MDPITSYFLRQLNSQYNKKTKTLKMAILNLVQNIHFILPGVPFQKAPKPSSL